MNSNVFEKMTIEILRSPKTLPEDVIGLRKKVYVEEQRYIAENNLISPLDKIGSHVIFRIDGQLAATGQVLPAAAADLGEYTGDIDLSGVGYSTRLMVAPQYRQLGLSKMLVYALAKELRLMGMKAYFVFLVPGGYAHQNTMRVEKIEAMKPRSVVGKDGQQYDMFAHGQELDYAMHSAWEVMDQNQRDWLADHVIFEEIAENADRIYARFYQHEWFEQARLGRLTRDQYVASLGGWYQFVKWTTRLLATVISVTEDPTLRRHYIRHLNGEVDHERLIEKDLEHLGADVSYVKYHLAPPRHIRSFMAIQESLAGFHRDPKLFLAVPFTVEGMSGKLDESVGQGLAQCVRTWGPYDPNRTLSFLGSHVVTDGAEDGHWNQSLAILKKVIRDDVSLRNFLEIASIVETSMSGALSEYLRVGNWRRSRTQNSFQTRRHVPEVHSSSVNV